MTCMASFILILIFTPFHTYLQQLSCCIHPSHCTIIQFTSFYDTTLEYIYGFQSTCIYKHIKAISPITSLISISDRRSSCLIPRSLSPPNHKLDTSSFNQTSLQTAKMPRSPLIISLNSHSSYPPLPQCRERVTCVG
ncbi:hypothetical protein GQ607_005106 [Colletotrichum asianum]|uniref:Secreted protein n=1 Tax=Colletotrichum asianum TaxID=702518 RepID=A0A8H3ZU66_9PEZI|nr:hypothetical protein GQ607_005106 [Colletotrichum asianum]